MDWKNFELLIFQCLMVKIYSFDVIWKGRSISKEHHSGLPQNP
jgi:hypothetical protein